MPERKLMKQLTECIRIRITKAELDYLKDCMTNDNLFSTKHKNGNPNFSAYIRNRLLASVNYKNAALAKQNDALIYQLRKIGVNINQAARKINAGYGSSQELTNLQQYMVEIEDRLIVFEKKVEELWESQS